MTLKKERPDLTVMIGAMDAVAEVGEEEMLGEVCLSKFSFKILPAFTLFKFLSLCASLNLLIKLDMNCMYHKTESTDILL